MLSVRLKSDLYLLLTAAVWGTGFVAQRLAAGRMGPFSFNGGRFLLAALILFVFARLFSGKFQAADSAGPAPLRSKQWAGMAGAGVLLFAAAGFQQAGLATTSIGNASFITGMYVVLVPVLLFFFGRARISWVSWASVGLAVVGVMLLSLQGELRLASGDALELAGALMWALHVILVGRIARQGVDVLQFSAVQFLVCGLLNLAASLALEPSGLAAMLDSWPAVAYSAVLPIGLGFTLQIAGQRHAPLIDAAILLSMEAVFATLFGYLFLAELLTGQQLAGCALLLAAMILSQAGPELLKRPRRSPSELNQQKG